MSASEPLSAIGPRSAELFATGSRTMARGEPGGRDRAALGAFIPAVSPKPCGLGLAGAGGEHRDRRVIGKDRLTRQHMPPDGIGQWCQQGGRFADLRLSVLFSH